MPPINTADIENKSEYLTSQLISTKTLIATRLTEQRLTSHQTQYRGQVFTGQMTQPTVSQHWRMMGPKDEASIPSGPSHSAHNKLIQHMQYTYRRTQKTTHSEMITRRVSLWGCYTPNLVHVRWKPLPRTHVRKRTIDRHKQIQTDRQTDRQGHSTIPR